MSEPRHDVLAVGNAIVDVLTHADDAFLARHGMAKGVMTLIDSARADELYAAMGAGVGCSGGSAANTAAVVASLGGRPVFVGKVRDDELGRTFAHDIEAAGVAFPCRPAENGTATARCLIFVTPDAQRTMNTFLGACRELAPADIDDSLVESAAVTYLEGYLWDLPEAKAAMRKACAAAHRAGRKVAFSLSDPFCVGRHRDEFRDLVKSEVDILLANEDEALALSETTRLDDALEAIRPHVAAAAVTRGARGCVAIAGGTTAMVPADAAVRVTDTTGAGDAFAAGFLYALTRGAALSACARLGNMAAARIIAHFGARPERPMTDLYPSATA